AWLIAQRERVRALELDNARLAGELAASERIERHAQRYADKLEEKLGEARKREASLARALGYAEAQRDQARVGPGNPLPASFTLRSSIPRPREKLSIQAKRASAR